VDISEPPVDYDWFMFDWDRARTSSMMQLEQKNVVRVMQAGGFKTATGDQPMKSGGKYYF
jgi:hypothetical protein